MSLKEEMYSMIEQWKSSGQSKKEFVSDKSVSIHKFGYWYGNGAFYPIGSVGIWWSSTEYDSNYAWLRLLLYSNGVVGRNDYNKTYGFSVRCLRD